MRFLNAEGEGGVASTGDGAPTQIWEGCPVGFTVESMQPRHLVVSVQAHSHVHTSAPELAFYQSEAVRDTDYSTVGQYMDAASQPPEYELLHLMLRRALGS